MAVEEPFVPVQGAARGGPRANVRSAIAVGQAQAVALIVAAHYNLPVFRYAPAQVKSAVSGYGQGSKDQVATMVGLLLNLSKPPEPEDASDALAVALCYVQQERMNTLTRTSP
jgi:crossover junction endodeoxyribonuclease RuvC